VEQIEIAIRWRDVDNYGHVNNAVYLTYLEECRDRWVRRTLGDDVGFVIVRVAIDFRRELSLEDGSVTVACGGTGYGTRRSGPRRRSEPGPGGSPPSRSR
jgi:Predicted thioesterase